MWTSEYTSYEPDSYDDLSHYGIRGMKWHKTRNYYRKGIMEEDKKRNARKKINSNKYYDKARKYYINHFSNYTTDFYTYGLPEPTYNRYVKEVALMAKLHDKYDHSNFTKKDYKRVKSYLKGKKDLKLSELNIKER